MKRPLIFILIFFIIGIVLAWFNNFYINFFLFGLVILGAYFLSRIYKVKTLNLLTFVTIFSFILTNFSLLPRSSVLEEVCLSKQFVEITGVVTKVVSSTSYEKVTIKTSSVKTYSEDLSDSVRIIAYVKNSKVYSGQEVILKGYLNKASKPSNPTDYDEQKYFYIQKIDYKIYPTYFTVSGVKNPFLYKLDTVQEELMNVYYNALPETEASILSGIILGDKSYIDQDTLAIYRNAGIYHILAISGLHITILVGFLSRIFNSSRFRFSGVFVILILIFYCIFTGASTSTIRATIMTSVSLIGFIIYRRYDIISSTCIAMLILLIKNPMNLFSVGFLYSFTSVFAIAFLGMKVLQIKEFPSYLQAFIISFFVSLAIKPITMYNFYNINLVDIFLNIIIIPLMSIVVVIGFLSILAAMINIKLAIFITGFVYYILRFFTYICLVVERIGFANLIVGRPSIFILSIYYLMIFLIAFSLYDKHLIRKRLKFIKIGVLIFLLAFVSTKFIPKSLQITMLKTSRGEAFVGEYGDFKFLVNSGNSYYTSSYSITQSVICPYLNSRGITRLDAIFVTSCSDDYITGVIEILDFVTVDKIFVPTSVFSSQNYKNLFEKANKYNIKVYELKSGDLINVGKNLSFEVLYPIEHSNISETELVFKLNFLHKSILFTSEDISFLEYIHTNADILKISNDEVLKDYDFIEMISPDFIISNLNLDKVELENYEDFDIITTSDGASISIKIYKNGKIKLKAFS